jgi:hypothetical protein
MKYSLVTLMISAWVVFVQPTPLLPATKIGGASVIESRQSNTCTGLRCHDANDKIVLNKCVYVDVDIQHRQRLVFRALLFPYPLSVSAVADFVFSTSRTANDRLLRAGRN